MKIINRVRFFLAIAIIMLLLPVVSSGAAADLKTYTLPLDQLNKRVSEVVSPGRVSFTDFYNIGAVEYADLKTAANNAIGRNGKLFINFITLSQKR